ncbi:thermonuclease family protein [Comamonas sp. E6]|uniref:thermonuclease family protein n=1 Tax=Comamonas sp. E6 TaxID=364029 RepID=UPI001EE7343B|nr:thermonuclease family protein [Comamonas sp. E6]
MLTPLLPYRQHLRRRHPDHPIRRPGQHERLKARLQGIDAPERKQPFGERARQTLAKLTFQKEAELRSTKTDRYRRQVCFWVAPASAPIGATNSRCWPGHDHPRHGLVVPRLCPRAVSPREWRWRDNHSFPVSERVNNLLVRHI